MKWISAPSVLISLKHITRHCFEWGQNKEPHSHIQPNSPLWYQDSICLTWHCSLSGWGQGWSARAVIDIISIILCIAPGKYLTHNQNYYNYYRVHLYCIVQITFLFFWLFKSAGGTSVSLIWHRQELHKHYWHVCDATGSDILLVAVECSWSTNEVNVLFKRIWTL